MLDLNPGATSTPVEIRHRLPPLRPLTSVRFLAAIYVVFYHQRAVLSVPADSLTLRFLNSGYTGVTLFFVLSGFILAYNYPRVAARKDFWIARFARVYPLYVFSLALMLAGISVSRHALVRPPHFALATLLAFTLLQSWILSLAFALNIPAWTLSVEAFFYVSFPFVLPLLQRVRNSAFIAFQLAYLLLLALPLLLALHPSTAMAGTRVGVFLESPFPLVRLNAFLLGVYTGVLFTRSFVRAGSAVLVLHPASRLHLWLLIPAVTVPLALFVWNPSVLWAPLRTGFLELAFALLLWCLAQVDWPILTNHTAQMAGEISYGIYILQEPVRLLYMSVEHRLLPRAAYSVAFDVVLLLVAAYCSFRWIEIPVRLWIRRTLTHRFVPTRPI